MIDRPSSAPCPNAAGALPHGAVLQSEERRPALSVVIPAFNEAGRIGATLDAVARYAREKNLSVEAIVSDDGSSDGTEFAAAGAQREGMPVRVVRSAGNRGKGHAVRSGALAARGRMVLFMDADSSAAIEELDRLAPHLEGGCDAVIASRSVAGSDVRAPQSIGRRIMGKTFNRTLRLLGLTQFHDTQCGFKLFRDDTARALFSCQTVEGFGFDVEILFLARRWGFKVEEVPIVWRDSRESKVKIPRDPLRMLKEAAAVRWNALRGRYPSRPPRFPE